MPLEPDLLDSLEVAMKWERFPRVFGGEIYYIWASYGRNQKHVAQTRAAIARKYGYKARVISKSEMSEIYVRRK